MRQILLLPLVAIVAGGQLWAQGMVSGNVSAAPRPAFSGRPFPVSLVDVAKASGLGMRFVLGHPAEKRYIVEANGTGMALVDFDGDGRLDIFAVNGFTLEGFSGGEVPTNHLFRNMGHGKFQDVTEKAGLDRFGWGNGVCSGDFDNDGAGDLYVTYWGKNSLFRNRGDGTFEDVAQESGTAGPEKEWTTGCTFLDYDRDGFLDLFTSSYVGFELAKTPRPGQFAFCRWKDAPVYCGPRGLPYGTLTLLHNRGNGTFEDVTAASRVGRAGNCYGFTATAADLNGDGWTDIYAACDSTPSLFFRNNKDRTFTELGTETGLAYNENGSEQAGMGIDIADYDNDGNLDVVKTNFIGDYPNLYHGIGRGIFDDVVVQAGLGVNPGYVVWGTGFVDLDNDGWKDLLQVTGHVYPEVDGMHRGERYRGPRLVYRNLGGGKFEDLSERAGPGVQEKHNSHGAAFGDFDNDGDMDAVIMNMDEGPSLLRNDLGNDYHWIKLLLEGKKSNRSAIGSMATVRAGGLLETAAVLSQNSFLSSSDRRLHFGLGQSDRVDKITVRWASGTVEEFPGAAADQLYVLVEGSGETKPMELPQ